MAEGSILESPKQVGPRVGARLPCDAWDRHPGLTRVEDAPKIVGKTSLDLFRTDAP